MYTDLLLAELKTAWMVSAFLMFVKQMLDYTMDYKFNAAVERPLPYTLKSLGRAIIWPVYYPARFLHRRLTQAVPRQDRQSTMHGSRGG